MSQTVKEIDKSDELYDKTAIEEDVPLFESPSDSKKGFDLKEEQFKEDAKDKNFNRDLIKVLTSWGFWLIVVSYILILVIHIVDTIILSNGLTVSGLSQSIFELCKSTITMLLGFLFAKSFELKK